MFRNIDKNLETAKRLAIEADDELELIHQIIINSTNPNKAQICQDRMKIVKEKHQQIQTIVQEAEHIMMLIRSSVNDGNLE